jgi:hypothetical protein
MPRPPSLFTLARAASAALGLATLSTAIPAAGAPEVTATAPVKNFRLPTFSDAGFRELLLVAGEARLPDPERIDVQRMEITLFTGGSDERVDVRLAAPLATFFPARKVATGPDSVRLERSDLVVTGADWTYDHLEGKVLIKRDAHVIFHAPLGDIIK